MELHCIYIQIIRRTSLEEKFLVVAKRREGHFCTKLWIVIGIIAWEGLTRIHADRLYDKLKSVLPVSGIPCEVSLVKRLRNVYQ